MNCSRSSSVFNLFHAFNSSGLRMGATSSIHWIKAFADSGLTLRGLLCGSEPADFGWARAVGTSTNRTTRIEMRIEICLDMGSNSYRDRNAARAPSWLAGRLETG